MSGNAAVEPKKKLKFLIAHEWEVGVLFIILVVCMVVFEKAMHLIEHRIAHSAVPQRGLKRALKKMKDELLVKGFCRCYSPHCRCAPCIRAVRCHRSCTK